MSVEQVIAVALPLDESGRKLVSDIGSAGARAADAEPGDRLDVVRYEALSSQIESLAFRMLSRDQFDGVVIELPEGTEVKSTLVAQDEEIPEAVPIGSRPSVQRILDDQGALVIITLPLEAGSAAPAASPVAARPPAERWEDPEGRKGSAAVRARFESQLERAVDRSGGAEPIVPSGIQNKALTEALRSFVNRTASNQHQVDVPVEYRDGSRATNPFALRSLDLIDQPGESDQKFSFALLSIRHTELDAIVDGAWLRNTQISQTRTQADTDDLVYSISRKQLSALTDGGKTSVAIEMYQTGLEPAIVGFYRAVVDHLLAHPGSLAVYPMYFQQPPKPREERPPKRRRGGKQQRNERGTRRNSAPTKQGGAASTPPEQDEAIYASGQVWATTNGGKAWAAPLAASRLR